MRRSTALVASTYGGVSMILSKVFGVSCVSFAILSTLAPASVVVAQTQSRASQQPSQRAAILNALRPRAARDLGPPVEFVVSEFRQQGNIAFVSVTAQRPGRREIDLTRTPVGKDGGAEEMDGPTIQAFFKRTGRVWQVDLYAIGATDVWYMDPVICATYARVMSASLCPANARLK
jgi:hypothetical protein